MINKLEFENLIVNPESSILDFKEEFYDFTRGKIKSSDSKLVKDIISFCNTIRNETSYIIFGIQKLENGSIELKGIENPIDDAIIQDKVKNKIFPRPVFSFYPIEFENKIYGVIEFPIKKYELPLTPSVDDLKGLESGKVYFRNGSSNTEANAIDIIRINNWFISINESLDSNPTNQELSNFLVRITSGNEKLSVIISELYLFAKQNSLSDLMNFCSIELKGFDSSVKEEIKHRHQIALVSWNKIEINPYSYIKSSASTLKSEMENNKEFFEVNFTIHYPIVEIEETLERFKKDNDTAYGTVKSDTKTVLGMEKKFDLYFYLFPDNFKSVYKNIRQKTIDMLMTD